MATIKDIAKEAGVSVTSVSRVLNERGYLSDGLKNKVFNAMEKLNYQPNEMARSLQSQKTSVLGLIIPDVSHPFFAQWTKAIEQEAFIRGYKIVLCNSHHDPDKEQEYVDMLRASRVDGLIFGSHTQDTRQYEFLEQPLVTFERDLGALVPRITADHQTGGKLAIEHLHEKGCQSILVVGGHPDLDISGEDRYSGAINSLERLNITYHWVQGGYHTMNMETLREDLVHLLRGSEKKYDGIFAGSDVIAGIVTQLIADAGYQVPDDVKVVGYDGSEWSRYMTVPLTTISQPINEMAKAAVLLLIDQIENPDALIQSPEPFPVILIQGKTT